MYDRIEKHCHHWVLTSNNHQLLYIIKPKLLQEEVFVYDKQKRYLGKSMVVVTKDKRYLVYVGKDGTCLQGNFVEKEHQKLYHMLSCRHLQIEGSFGKEEMLWEEKDIQITCHGHHEWIRKIDHHHYRCDSEQPSIVLCILFTFFCLLQQEESDLIV